MREEVSSKACTSRGFDLITTNLQESLHVFSVSSPLNIIHGWNDHKRKNVEALFEFAFAYPTNDDPLLPFVLVKKDVRDVVRTYTNSYNFVLGEDRWDLNGLTLGCSVDTCLTIQTKLYVVLMLHFLPLHCVQC